MVNMTKKNVKSKAKHKVKPKAKKKNLLVAVDESTSNLKSDEPSVREGSLTPELVNEDDREDEEDSENRSFYGKHEEGI